MQTGQQPGEPGEGVRDDGQVRQEDAGIGAESPEGDVIFGIISIGSHDTIGSGGRRTGYMMGIVDPAGQKFYVDIPESTYRDLVGIYAVTVQKFQDVSMGVSRPEQPTVLPPSEESPTGTPVEVEQMRRMMLEATQAASPGDVMKKLGFVSDNEMLPSVASDPVEDLLAMASDDDEDYEDHGEGSFAEDVEEI